MGRVFRRVYITPQHLLASDLKPSIDILGMETLQGQLVTWESRSLLGPTHSGTLGLPQVYPSKPHDWVASCLRNAIYWPEAHQEGLAGWPVSPYLPVFASLTIALQLHNHAQLFMIEDRSLCLQSKGFASGATTAAFVYCSYLQVTDQDKFCYNSISQMSKQTPKGSGLVSSPELVCMM